MCAEVLWWHTSPNPLRVTGVNTESFVFDGYYVKAQTSKYNTANRIHANLLLDLATTPD